MYSLFSEQQSENAVIERLQQCKDDRFKTIMTSAIKHLHGFVKEVEPTMEEWMAAIQFLTATGQMCDDKRQEWILASDTLGVSMLLETLNHRSEDGSTEATVLGPFHVEGAPDHEMGDSICLDGKGVMGEIRGHVLDTNGKPIEHAVLDIWQANEEGFYDVQQPEIQPDMNMRGKFRTSADGSFRFITSKPKSYPVPADGPVGKMLTKMGRHSYRPGHTHFIVSADGFETLITHIFVEGDEYLDSDAVFGVKESLIVPFVDKGDSWVSEFDILLKSI